MTARDKNPQRMTVAKLHAEMQRRLTWQEEQVTYTDGHLQRWLKLERESRNILYDHCRSRIDDVDTFSITNRIWLWVLSLAVIALAVFK